MKSFAEYLLENIEAKKYAFKIKIAGDLPENCEEVMETALKKYEVSKFTKSKTTPIQPKVSDFPTMENVQVNIFDIELDYPTTSQVLSSYVSEHTGIAKDRIRVRSPLEEAELELNSSNTNEETKGGKPLIGQCDFPASNNQKMVGDKGVANFLKELIKNRKDTEPKQYKGVNDALLAKKLPKEKANEMAKPGPARSALQGLSGNPNPRKGK